MQEGVRSWERIDAAYRYPYLLRMERKKKKRKKLVTSEPCFNPFHCPQLLYVSFCQSRTPANMVLFSFFSTPCMTIVKDNIYRTKPNSRLGPPKKSSGYDRATWLIPSPKPRHPQLSQSNIDPSVRSHFPVCSSSMHFSPPVSLLPPNTPPFLHLASLWPHDLAFSSPKDQIKKITTKKTFYKNRSEKEKRPASLEVSTHQEMEREKKSE